MAIVYNLPPEATPNPYPIAEDIYKEQRRKKLLAGQTALQSGVQPSLKVGYDLNPDGSALSGANPVNYTVNPIAAAPAATQETPAAAAQPSVEEQVKAILGQTTGSAASEQIKASALASAEAQNIQTQQEVDRLEYQKVQAAKARAEANKAAGLTFSRAINPTGKLNQNIRGAGLAGSGWQETSQVGLTNEYQNALNTNTSNYSNAVKEIDLTISQAKQSGNVAVLQMISNYAAQLANQLYQEARAAEADRQWQKSYDLQVAAFELDKMVKMNAMSGSGGGSGGSSGSSRSSGSGSGTKSTSGGGQLFSENGALVSGMTPDEAQLYYLNHPITNPDTGEEMDYERFPSTIDSFKVDSSWSDNPVEGVIFEIQNSIGRNTTPEEAAHIAASFVYANTKYLSDAEMDYILNQFGTDQDQAAAILSGTGTGSAYNNRFDTSISDNDWAYWQAHGGN
jgi:hypothetical protein